MFTTTRPGRRAAAVTAALAAAALVGGPAGTTSFADTGTHTAHDGPATAHTAGLRWVTLVTGDRVGVNALGSVVTLDRAEGREKIPVRTLTRAGRVFVIPADAERLISQGRLDPRLFDITGLTTPESRRAHGKGLKVIVAYQGTSAPAARAGVRGDAEVRRTLPSINAEAVTVPERDPGALWAALTRTTGTHGARTARTAPGVAKIWLDAVRTAQLDTSVARIGAPKAWEAGYDGTGVTIAVLDTGVDGTHADLRGRVAAERNFSDSRDAKDRNGHGTHVASTAAGTGARSGGKHKGVAPGAKILNAKVLNDASEGLESGILAGMDWAVARGAEVINMSLGSENHPGVDPMEAHVNKLSKEKGVLFVVAAGNSGPLGGTVGSPGSADAALTVGAVDDTDRLAPFSGRGRTADGGMKPDITAPGVSITAASAPGSTLARQEVEKPAGYVTISGTSMATPHVAGAAALLKQRHPSWPGERIKAALTASAQDSGHGVLEQGTGRVVVDRALAQSVVADRTSLSFAKQLWPHTDDKPATRTITYRNTGDHPVTLDLAVKASDPNGKAAPASSFTLGTNRVTVPAGGTAAVPLTSDTRAGGTVNGVYTAAVVATGGGQTIRTNAAVEREVESYALTLRHIGRDGRPSKEFRTVVIPHSGGERPGSAHGVEYRSSATLRLPKGDHTVDTVRLSGAEPGYDRLVQPRLTLTRNIVLTLDARRARPVSLSIPDTRAESTGGAMEYRVEKDGRLLVADGYRGGLAGVRTAQLGPAQPTGITLKQTFHGQWERGATQYNAATGGTVKRLATGLTKKFKAADFAKITVTMGTSVKGKSGRTTVVSGLDGFSEVPRDEFALPGRRTHHVATDGGRNSWAVQAVQAGDSAIWKETEYLSPMREHKPGRSHQVTVGRPVHSPAMHAATGAFRHGDALRFEVPLFSDAAGNAGYSQVSASTTLHRGTELIKRSDQPLGGPDGFAVDPGSAEYTLATSVKRSKLISRTATRVDASWTLRSARPAGGGETRTPLSAVRFGVPVALNGTAPAGRTVTFPVTVQGPAAGAGLKSLTVSVSYDGGKTWRKLTVTRGKATIENPAKGRSVALRGEVTDTRGGRASVTVHDAYHGG